MIFAQKILSNCYLLLLILTVFTAAGIVVKMVLGEDPGFGFSVWESMQNGGSFNTLLIPSPANIAQNQALFLTWWSPGQYLIPGFLSAIFHITLGTASLWTTLLFSMLGLWGWQKIYQQLGFENALVGICLFLIATSRLFTINFLNYTGGELLLFGGQPWTIWFYLKYQKKPIFLFFGLLALSLACFFFKTAHTIGLLALVGCAGLSFLEGWIIKRKFLNIAFWLALSAGLCAVCYLAIVQFGFLQFGLNPISSTNQPFKMLWPSFEILTYPVTHWWSWSELYVQLAARVALPQWTFGVYYGVLLVGFVAMVLITLQTRYRQARWVFVGFFLAYHLIFLFLYNKAAEISIEYRHTKVVAYLFLPILMSVVIQPKFWSKLAFVGILVLNTGYGLASFGLKKAEIWQELATNSQSGFALRHTTNEDLAFVHLVDKPENILYFTSSSLNVEATQARKIMGSIDFKFAKGCGFVADRYAGKAGNIYAFMQKEADGPALESIFPAYRFRLLKQTQKFKIFVGE